MKKITIKDIARKASVSPSTVSKIITGKYKDGNIQISKETIKKVKQIIKKLNYTPNYAARLLITGKSSTIGIFMPRLKHPNFHLQHYYSEILNSLEKNAVLKKYDLLLINYDSYITKFDTKRIDALIIIEQIEPEKQLEYLINQKKPFVVINNLVDSSLSMPSIGIDNYLGVKYIVDHFIERNHKSLAFIGEMVKTPQKEHIIRLEAFKSILHERKMDVNESLFLLGERRDITDSIPDNYFDQFSGYNGMKYLIEKYRNQFTGVFCSNDLIALGALNYLYANGIRVPEELSIIGFDDLDFSAYLMGGLTTVKQPINKIGTKAFSMLLDIMKNGDKSEPPNIKIPPLFIKRNTVTDLTTLS